MLNIYNIETQNYVNGNGCRYVLWVQGCDLACIGCWNQATWSFENNTLKSVEEIFTQIKSLEDEIDGVTFSGGEPFLQALELSCLAKKIKTETKLNIQIFSGFSIDELHTKEHKELLKYTDILVAGRFDSSKERNNQKVYILNDKVDEWEFNNSDIEIDICPNGDIILTGYPSDVFINEITGDNDARI